MYVTNLEFCYVFLAHKILYNSVHLKPIIISGVIANLLTFHKWLYKKNIYCYILSKIAPI